MVCAIDTRARRCPSLEDLFQSRPGGIRTLTHGVEQPDLVTLFSKDPDFVGGLPLALDCQDYCERQEPDAGNHLTPQGSVMVNSTRSESTHRPNPVRASTFQK